MDENSKVRRREEEQIEAEGEDSMSFEETRPAKRPLFLRHLCPYDERYMDDRRTKLEQEDEQDSEEEEEESDDFDGMDEAEEEDLSASSAFFLLEARFESLCIARRDLFRAGEENLRTNCLLPARAGDG